MFHSGSEKKHIYIDIGQPKESITNHPHDGNFPLCCLFVLKLVPHSLAAFGLYSICVGSLHQNVNTMELYTVQSF